MTKLISVLYIIVLIGLCGGEDIFSFYNTTFFPILGRGYDIIFGQFSWPTIYLICILICVDAAHFIVRYRTIGLVLAHHILTYVLRFFMRVFALFYILWGFNYFFQPLEMQYPKPIVSIDCTNIDTGYLFLVQCLNTLRQRINDDKLDNLHVHYSTYESLIRQSQSSLLKDKKVHSHIRIPRVKLLKPDGILLRFSTAGMYIPHAMEGYIDGGIHNVQIPFTMAHEMAHVYGITDEGFCNYLALLTCLDTQDDIIIYSALLTLYRYIRTALRQCTQCNEDSNAYILHPLVKNDLDEIIYNMRKYEDIMPAMRDIMYKKYLTMHGIKAGLTSYNQIVIRYLISQDSIHQVLKNHCLY